MKQKYHLRKKFKEKELLIREYAVLDTSPSKKGLPAVHGDNYSLLCEQSYDAKDIKDCLSKGKDSLISLLRNSHFYPIGVYMDKIADAVTDMYTSRDKQREDIVEDLIFDDRDFMFLALEEPEIESEIKEVAEAESSDEVDDLV
jgi:hypothetical protein